MKTRELKQDAISCTPQRAAAAGHLKFYLGIEIHFSWMWSVSETALTLKPYGVF